ncbi:MAG: O-antigen ligase family protein [Nitrospirae bacterium]|nr:O-antigen ligase family protein [Nitrospirota bacterium]
MSTKDYLKGILLLVYLSSNAVLCVIYPFYIVIALNLLVIFTVLFSIKPAWGVYLLIFLVPISRDSLYFVFTGEWNFKVSDAYINLLPVFTPVFLFTCVGFLLHKGASLWQSDDKSTVNLLLISIAVYAAFTLFWTENIQHSMFQYYYLVTNIMLLVIIVSAVTTDQTHRMIMWAVVFSCLFEAVMSYYFRFIDTSIFEHEFFESIAIGGRNYGGLLSVDGSPVQAHGLQEAHETSMLMNIFMGVSAGLFLTESGLKKRIFLVCCFILGLSVLIGTESRAGAASFILMGMFFLFFHNKTSRYFVTSAAIFLSALLVFYVVQQKIFSVLAGKEDTIMRLLMLGEKAVDTGDVLDPGLTVKEGAGPGRRTIWGVGFTGLTGKWPFGVGIGNYKYFSRSPHAHSVPFSFLFDFGLIGLSLFLSIVFVTAKSYIKLIRSQQTYIQIMSLCIMSTLMAIVFQGCFDFDYTYPLFWLFGGILFSTLRLGSKGGK